MTTTAILMVKDEADIISGTLHHLLGEVDRIVVSDNGSTDGTREILADLDFVEVQDDPDPAYYQAWKMSKLAEQVGEGWIVPVDADELWYAEDRLRTVLPELPSHINVVQAPLFNHFCTAIDVHDPDPFRGMVWRQRDAGALPKVVFRWEPKAFIHQGNHGVDLPSGLRQTSAGVALRHFPYRSEDQFIRKARNGAAAYAATDLPENEGAHWRGYGQILERHGEDALREVFRTHFFYPVPFEDGMVQDPAPYRRWLT